MPEVRELTVFRMGVSTPMWIMEANVKKKRPGVPFRPLKEFSSQFPDVCDIAAYLKYRMMFFCI